MTPDLLAQLFQDPARAAEVPAEEIPAVLGELERIRTGLWARMMSAAARDGQSEATGEVQGQRARLPRELSPREIGERLGLSPRSVHDLLRTKRLPGYRVGRLWRVNEAELQAWVERQKKGLDTGGNTVLSSGHDEARGSAGPARPGAVSIEVRRAPGRAQADGPPMGGGALPRERARRAADPAARRTAGDPGEAS